MHEQDPQILKKILWTDECTFQHGESLSNKCRTRSSASIFDEYVGRVVYGSSMFNMSILSSVEL
ncbi:Protein of unknown function [Cotesia congregata]|uniref:Uncharacterized protein n=1 Tax=Cotesia congregata TaxID=51543 RepID=A0A8J2HUG5_COTCN|nr:Protein of unknown function [Cotesia congregata]